MNVTPAIDVAEPDDLDDEKTKRALPREVSELVVRMGLEEEVTSVVHAGEVILVSEDEPEIEDELEILESWFID